MTRSARRDLRDKYLRITRLRDARPEDPSTAIPAMRRLAARFPGALRELDQLEPERLAEKLVALAPASDDEPLAPWMEAQIAFHALLRGALVAKRWRRARPGRTFDELVKWTDDADVIAWGPSIARLEATSDTDSTRRLPVVALALAVVAERLGVDQAAARALVFGPPKVLP